jgi:RNA polymerase sigma-70 factor (ECF subfamily)
MRLATSSKVSFPATSWSQICRAGKTLDDDVRRQAVTAIVTRYLPPLRRYLVVHHRADEHHADDLLQGFLLSKVIDLQILRRADRERGKFRTFLLTALDHYVLDEIRKQAAAKRRHDHSAIPLDAVSEAGQEPHSRTAVDSFDIEWGQQVLGLTLERMRLEFEEAGRLDLWNVFHARILTPVLENVEAPSYQVLAEKFRFRSPEQATNLLVTAKRAFARHLRETVAEYAEDGDDVEEEIRQLRQILSSRRA